MTSPISPAHPQTAPDGEAALRQRDAALTAAWQRLSPRLARSAEQARRHMTVRAADMPFGPGPDGLTTRIVYQAGDLAAVKPGEPTKVRLIDAPAGARVAVPIDANANSAWLVLDGQADIGAVHCAQHDYQERRAGESSVTLATTRGARVLLRESRPSPHGPGSSSVHTTHAEQMAWEALAEGVSRRLLAPPKGSAAAYLVQLAAGAAAPAHRHGHAEECLVLEGEMYLDDILLFSGDFQLARAGGQHHEASSERGVLLLVHGDLDLDVIDAGHRCGAT